MNEFSQDYEPDVAVEPPKKRRGWPKGQKRGPRKAKGSAANGAAKVRKPSVQQRDYGDISDSPKSLTELMFNVDRRTADILEVMVKDIQELPEDCRRDLIAALQRVFDEH
jgi:hypothetical protein